MCLLNDRAAVLPFQGLLTDPPGGVLSCLSSPEFLLVSPGGRSIQVCPHLLPLRLPLGFLI